MWLPTVKGKPIPSSGLIADVPAVGEVALMPWIITALPLPVPLVIDLLCACIDRDTIAAGILIGPTLAFWTRALRLAGALVAREQFVPGLRKEGTSWRACWQPVIAGGQCSQAHPNGEAVALDAFKRTLRLQR